MTAKRDLKKRVRERQDRTGERYTTALAHVLARRHTSPAGAPDGPAATGIPVVELRELSAEALRVGLKCRVVIFPELAARVDCSVLLERIRDLLLATESDPGMRVLRSVMLHGERPVATRGEEMMDDWWRLISRAQAGLGGVSESGKMMAMSITGHYGLETILCLVWPIVPAWLARHPSVVPIHPTVILTRPGELTFSSDFSPLTLP